MVFFGKRRETASSPANGFAANCASSSASHSLIEAESLSPTLRNTLDGNIACAARNRSTAPSSARSAHQIDGALAKVVREKQAASGRARAARAMTRANARQCRAHFRRPDTAAPVQATASR